MSEPFLFLAQAPPAASAPAWLQFVPMLLILVVFYFLLVAPMRKKQRELQGMIDKLQKGDRVVLYLPMIPELAIAMLATAVVAFLPHPSRRGRGVAAGPAGPRAEPAGLGGRHPANPLNRFAQPVVVKLGMRKEVAPLVGGERVIVERIVRPVGKRRPSG